MLIFLIFFIKNLLFITIGIQEFRKEYFIPLIQVFVLYCFRHSISESLLLFGIMHCVNSYLLVLTSWAVHHHDLCWHDGDSYDSDKDYGRHILKSTRDHSYSNMYINFLLWAGLNDHVLHHMFPVIDHSRYNEIRPELVETCREFGLEFGVYNFYDLFLGVLRRLIQSGTVMNARYLTGLDRTSKAKMNY